MTSTEENALAVFLQGSAVALVKFINEVPPEDQTIENFLKLLGGCSQEILKDESANTPEIRAAVSTLQAAWEKAIDQALLATLPTEDQIH